MRRAAQSLIRKPTGTNARRGFAILHVVPGTASYGDIRLEVGQAAQRRLNIVEVHMVTSPIPPVNTEKPRQGAAQLLGGIAAVLRGIAELIRAVSSIIS